MARNDSAESPRKTRWYNQIWNAFQMTRAQDPSVTWWVLGAILGVLLLGALIGWLTGALALGLILAIPTALLAGLFLLTRKAEAAAYRQIEGQPGAARAAVSTISRQGWQFENEPVAFNQRTGDLVFRGVGRGGVVLLSEGPPERVGRLLAEQEKRVRRLVPNVPITLIQMGDHPDQTALTKVSREVVRIKPVLTKQEVTAVSKRLQALGGQKLPLPKGVDPMRARPDRRGMRGR